MFIVISMTGAERAVSEAAYIAERDSSRFFEYVENDGADSSLGGADSATDSARGLSADGLSTDACHILFPFSNAQTRYVYDDGGEVRYFTADVYWALVKRQDAWERRCKAAGAEADYDIVHRDLCAV